MNYIRIAKTALFAGLFSIVSMIANAQTSAAKDEWKKELQRRIDIATDKAKERCGRDMDCTLRIGVVQAVRSNVVGQCVNIEIQASAFELRVAMAEINGEKISLEQKKIDNAAIAEARKTCDNALKENGEKVISAFDSITPGKK